MHRIVHHLNRTNICTYYIFLYVKLIVPKFLAVIPNFFKRFMYKYVIINPRTMYKVEISTRTDIHRKDKECKCRTPCRGISPKSCATVKTVNKILIFVTNA